jgi:uncharacterized protein (DUF111 family)
MVKLDKCYKIVQQSSEKGIRTTEIARKLGVHRTTAYKHLNSLELMGKVENKQGIWYAKTGEQTIKPLEKEIIIELPMPKNKWFDVARLEAYANYVDDMGLHKVAKINRVFLEKFNETRTIRVKGKNVDDLDLEKLGELIQQATKKSSRFNLRGLFKGSKRSRPNSKKPSE